MVEPAIARLENSSVRVEVLPHILFVLFCCNECGFLCDVVLCVDKVYLPMKFI